MKNKPSLIRILGFCAALLLTAALSAGALAQEYNAQAASQWLVQFASALSQLAPVNDPASTADPARAGQRLFEYEFGTVLASGEGSLSASQILEIDVRTAQVTDCRGVRAGMPLAQALGGGQIAASGTQLSVLDTQESGYGWSWAYVNGETVYGVEFITYGGEEAQMTEYTLTYVVDEGVISAIRMKMAPATEAQAKEGLATAQEIAARQVGEVTALQNGEAAFSAADLVVMGRAALGVQVADLIASLGEPKEIQTLPDAAGRILVYDGAAVTLSFNEQTGMEIVRGVSVTGHEITGPRGLAVGMSVQEAAGLMRCDQDVNSFGGSLYVLGEAAGEPPYGELIVQPSGEMTLSYACVADSGETAMLQAGMKDGCAAYWLLYYPEDVKGGM